MPPKNDRPNVLVIMCDQMKATASHLYGSAFCETPSMARLAGEGVLYRHAFTPHPLCVPARISLWVGQYPHTHGGRRNQTLMPAGHDHAFRHWKAAGFHCGLIGKNHCFETAEDLALFDTWCEITHNGIPAGAHHAGLPWVRPPQAIAAAHALRNAMPPCTPPLSWAVSDFPIEDYGTSVVTDQTVRFLETQAGADSPFALWVSYPDPHSPLEAPRRYADMFPPERVVMPVRREGEMDAAPERTRVLETLKGSDHTPEEEVRRQIGVYHAMTRFVDGGLGTILDALERLDLRRRTIVVFCSDHGDFTGEHGIMDKGGGFYDCLVRVPLILSWPGEVPSGVCDESMTNLVDIVPTLFALQGIEGPCGMQGQPLPVATSEPGRDAAFSEYGAGGPFCTRADLEGLQRPFMETLQWREAEGRRKMVRTREWKYVHDPMGDRDELYDLNADPWELENRVDDPSCVSVVADMRRRLLAWSISTEDPRPVPLPSLPERKSHA